MITEENRRSCQIVVRLRPAQVRDLFSVAKRRMKETGRPRDGQPAVITRELLAEWMMGHSENPELWEDK